MNFPGLKSSPALAETVIRAISRGGLPSQPTSNILPSSSNTISSNGPLVSFPCHLKWGKEISWDLIIYLGVVVWRRLLYPLLSNWTVLPQPSKSSNGLGSSETGNTNDSAVVGSRTFNSPVVPGMQWRPEIFFQNQTELVGMSHSSVSVFVVHTDSSQLFHAH